MNRYGPAWPRIRAAVLERDGYRCQLCGDPAPAKRCGRIPAGEADHIVPVSEGGALYDLANLRALCRPCNRRRGGYTAQAARLASTLVGRAPSRWAALPLVWILTGSNWHLAAAQLVDGRLVVVIALVLVVAIALTWRAPGRSSRAELVAVVLVVLAVAVLLAWLAAQP